MRTEDIRNIVIDEIHKECRFNNITLIIVFIGISLLAVMYCFVLWHNSNTDYRNEQLEFCLNIYDSDHVVLEQCKDYFIILGDDK